MTLTVLLIGFILGFIICIPIGPIGIWTVNTKINKGFKAAYSIALGGSLMDFFYFFIIMSGLSIFKLNQKLTTLLQITGILIIVSLGLKEIITKFKLDRTKKLKPLSKYKLGGYFLLGIIIYGSNPTLLISMSGLAAYTKSFYPFEGTLLNNFVISFGLALGSACWFLLLLLLVEKYDQAISNKVLMIAQKVCGALMVLFGSYMGAMLIS